MMLGPDGWTMLKDIEQEVERVVLSDESWERTKLLEKINEQRCFRPITEDQLREAVWSLYRKGKVEFTSEFRLTARRSEPHKGTG